MQFDTCVIGKHMGKHGWVCIGDGVVCIARVLQARGTPELASLDNHCTARCIACNTHVCSGECPFNPNHAIFHEVAGLDGLRHCQRSLKHKRHNVRFSDDPCLHSFVVPVQSIVCCGPPPVGTVTPVFENQRPPTLAQHTASQPTL